MDHAPDAVPVGEADAGAVVDAPGPVVTGVTGLVVVPAAVGVVGVVAGAVAVVPVVVRVVLPPEVVVRQLVSADQ